MGKIISLEDKKRHLSFIKDNLGKLSQRKISRRLEIGKTTVNRWAKELGFKFQKHTVNENFLMILMRILLIFLGLFVLMETSLGMLKSHIGLLQ